MANPATPPPSSGPSRGSTWLPWVFVLAAGGLLLLRWLGVFGPC